MARSIPQRSIAAPARSRTAVRTRSGRRSRPTAASASVTRGSASSIPKAASSRSRDLPPEARVAMDAPLLALLSTTLMQQTFGIAT
jgi:hypothetical protein